MFSNDHVFVDRVASNFSIAQICIGHFADCLRRQNWRIAQKFILARAKRKNTYWNTLCRYCIVCAFIRKPQFMYCWNPASFQCENEKFPFSPSITSLHLFSRFSRDKRRNPFEDDIYSEVLIDILLWKCHSERHFFHANKKNATPIMWLNLKIKLIENPSTVDCTVFLQIYYKFKPDSIMQHRNAFVTRINHRSKRSHRLYSII